MIKAVLLIFEPVATWEGIFRARRGIPFIVAAFLLPLLLLTLAGEAYGWVHWGKWQAMGHLKRFSLGEVLLAQAGQLLLSLVVVFAGASLVKAVGETFRGRHTYTESFTAVAYGLSPLFLLRLLDGFRGISPWVSWGIGIILAAAVLYHGVPRMMSPDPAHAFGLFLMSALLLALVTGLARFVTVSYLQGRLTHFELTLSAAAARLPF